MRAWNGKETKKKDLPSPNKDSPAPRLTFFAGAFFPKTREDFFSRLRESARRHSLSATPWMTDTTAAATTTTTVVPPSTEETTQALTLPTSILYYRCLGVNKYGRTDYEPAALTKYEPGVSVALAIEYEHLARQLLPLLAAPARTRWDLLVYTYVPEQEESNQEKRPTDTVIPRLFKCTQRDDILKTGKLPIAALPAGSNQPRGMGFLARQYFDRTRVIPIDPAADDDLSRVLTKEDMDLLLSLREIIVDLQLLLDALDEIAPGGNDDLDRTRLIAPKQHATMHDWLTRLRDHHTDVAIARYIRYQYDLAQESVLRDKWGKIHAEFREKFPRTPELEKVELTADDMRGVLLADVDMGVTQIYTDYEACTEERRDSKMIRLVDLIPPRLFWRATLEAVARQLRDARDNLVDCAIEIARIPRKSGDPDDISRTEPFKFPDPRQPEWMPVEYAKKIARVQLRVGTKALASDATKREEEEDIIARCSAEFETLRYTTLTKSVGLVAAWHHHLLLLWAMRGMTELDPDNCICCVASATKVATQNVLLAVMRDADSRGSIPGSSVFDKMKDLLRTAPKQDEEDTVYSARCIDALLFAYRLSSRVNQLIVGGVERE